MKKFLLNEFWLGYSLFEKIYILVMLLVQVIVFIINPDSILNIVAGISGVISVVLCAKGKISFYYIGFIQTITYLVLSFQEHFYGEVIENIFYLVTMIIGIFIWKKNLALNDDGSTQIKPKKLTVKQYILAIITTIISTILIGYALTLINSSQAYIDAATNVIAVIAQLLMIKGYKEQWIWWLVLNVLCLIMWFNAANYSMVFMYISWIINCVYGWINYTKVAKKQSGTQMLSKNEIMEDGCLM